MALLDADPEDIAEPRDQVGSPVLNAVDCEARDYGQDHLVCGNTGQICVQSLLKVLDILCSPGGRTASIGSQEQPRRQDDAPVAARWR